MSNEHLVRAKVLIVDDTDLVVSLLRRYLEPAGYVVGSAPDGPAGLQKFREGSWDLVITDRVMPGMTGEEMAAEIKNADPRIPVVLITGTGSALVRRELFDAVLDKPFTLAEVLACVERVLRGHA